jgi:hypothetical protein
VLDPSIELNWTAAKGKGFLIENNLNLNGTTNVSENILVLMRPASR